MVLLPGGYKKPTVKKQWLAGLCHLSQGQKTPASKRQVQLAAKAVGELSIWWGF